MMTSSYGCSIRKPRLLKNKYSNNVEKTVDDYYEYIAGYSFNNNEKTGFVNRILSFNPHFNYPQLASSMMNQYHEFMEKISKLVEVKFWNVDAILIDEVGYNKLKDLRIIGDKLGQFKIEKVSQEIAILRT